MLVAGVDIGNSTTEVMIARKNTQQTQFLGYGSAETTGIKGSEENVTGILNALSLAQRDAGVERVDHILINETAPVVSRLSADIVSQTIVVGSAMIGHNPDTPGGMGIGVGRTVYVEDVLTDRSEDYIVVIKRECEYEAAARMINEKLKSGISITGAIAANDDGVLISNRLEQNIPIVDEVRYIEKVPMGEKAAVEVASNGATIKILSNPYGIAGIFSLTPEQTKAITPIAKTLIGARSGVVIYSPKGEVKLNKVNAGSVVVNGDRGELSVQISDGAEKINEIVNSQNEIFDVFGEAGTNAGEMFRKVKKLAAERTGQREESIKISDISAFDTLAPIKIVGGIAGEHAMENVVLISSMVKTSYFPMNALADKVSERTGISVRIAGKEAVSALFGALTTQGTNPPFAILDLGGGSTDAAFLNEKGITYLHTAGAGDMVTTIIDLELSLGDRDMAELIKRHPLAKAESLHILRFEDQTVKFLAEPMPPEFFARTLIVTEDKLIPIVKRALTMERIANVRTEAKKKVFTANALRALSKVAPQGNIRNIDFVVMVGGSALDFEVPALINEALGKYSIVAGRGNILNRYSSRGAVAAGLILSSDAGGGG